MEWELRCLCKPQVGVTDRRGNLTDVDLLIVCPG